MTNPQRLKLAGRACRRRAHRAGHAHGGVRVDAGLALIVVDEEHDPSYKQQEGARYSARDLAVWRGREENARVLLGSATPSLESWLASERGRYQRLAMPSRIGAGQLPKVRLLD
jgi:primosomal protein N' (replication factor Y)